MEGLTKEQLDFLKEHKVHLKFVFDAQGMSKSVYRPIMKDLNKYIAFNVTPCNKYGHTLRTRSGHCCQCNTAHMAFQKRNDSIGVTYIGGTLTGNVIKVGFITLPVSVPPIYVTPMESFLFWKAMCAVLH